jgi:hypothetical protein
MKKHKEEHERYESTRKKNTKRPSRKGTSITFVLIFCILTLSSSWSKIDQVPQGALNQFWHQSGTNNLKSYGPYLPRERKNRTSRETREKKTETTADIERKLN